MFECAECPASFATEVALCEHAICEHAPVAATVRDEADAWLLDTAPEPTEYEVIARKLIDAATDRRVGGTSIWQGETADHGYLVGLPGRGLVATLNNPARMAQAQIDALVQSVTAWVERTHALPYAATWGSWVDRSTNIVYFDISSHYAHEDDARTACESRGEIAYWDVAGKREVRVVKPSPCCGLCNPRADGSCRLAD